MDCKHAKRFITPWVDRELQDSTGQELMNHLERCTDCKREFELERRLKAMLTEKVPRVGAPSYLYQRILTSLNTPPSPPTWRERLQTFFLLYRTPAFAGVAAFLILIVTASLFSSRSESPLPLVTDLVEHHDRCAMQVVSNQPEEIKTWFKGQVNFAVIAPRLDRFHSRLLGAHICQAVNRKVAYVVYDLNGKRVSVCMLNGARISLDRLRSVRVRNTQFYTATYQGQNLVFWRDNDRICSFIGPMKQDDLLAMATETVW